MNTGDKSDLYKSSTPSTLVVAASSITHLVRAFAKVAGNRGAPGVDRVTINTFAVGLERRLTVLSNELRSGLWWPDPVRLVEIPKRTGGTRRLAIPTVSDRVVETAMAMILSPRLEPLFEEASFGYRPGRSVAQAVARLDMLRRSGWVWTVDCDIDDFFDSVPHEAVIEKLAAAVKDRGIADLAARVLDAFAPEGRGLPQGSPISPLLANLHLDAVDEAITKAGLGLVRFADDFVVLTKSAKAAEKALELVRSTLAEHGLRLDPDKTSIVPFDRELAFLGHRFVRGMMMKSASVPTPEELAGAGPGVVAAREDGAEATDEDIDQTADDDLVDPLSVLYLMEPGRRLCAVGAGLGVVEGDRIVAAFPPRAVGRVEIGPRASAEPEGLTRAAILGVPLAFVDGAGESLAELSPVPLAAAKLHLAQARTRLDPAVRLDLAKRLVIARLRTQRALLSRLNRRRRARETAEAGHEIGRLLRLAAVQDDVESLMGVEGRAGALYWPALGAMLEPPFSLATRRRRLGAGPVNLALDMLAARLTRDIEALVRRRGLHPGFAFLHAVEDGRESLALDVIEPFRAALIEGHVVYLFNSGRLPPALFEVDGERTCATAEAAKRLISAHEAWLARAAVSPRSGRRSTWRGLIDEEIGEIAAELRGERRYIAFDMSY